MMKVYVLMYWSDEGRLKDVNTGETSPPMPRPYAVFEDKFTAERMKRDGDAIFEVPFFREDFPNVLKVDETKLNVVPCVSEPWQVQHTWPRSDDSTLAPFPPPNYPKVTCNKTVDEHSWTNRVD